MSSKNLPWLRLYTEIVDDDKLRLLAFEDRWHYIAILCLKGSGLLDEECSQDLKLRRIAVKLGLSTREVAEVARRLAEVGLVDAETLQPGGWDDRQMKSDTSTDRVKAYRERTKQVKRFSNVPVTAQDTDTELDKDKEEDKNNTPSAAADDVKSSRAKTLKTADLVGMGVDKQAADDYLALRKAKRAPLTKTALEAIVREASLAGVSLDTAVRLMVERNWQGLKAEWLQREQPGARQPRVNDLPTNYGQSGVL